MAIVVHSGNALRAYPKNCPFDAAFGRDALWAQDAVFRATDPEGTPRGARIERHYALSNGDIGVKRPTRFCILLSVIRKLLFS